MVFVSALVMGLCVGWLAGLSMSPVAQAVLTGLLALVAGAAGLAATKSAGGASAGTEPASSRPLGAITIDARAAYFVMILIIGVAIGAPVGIVVRTHNVLGPDPQTAPMSPKAGSNKDATKQADVVVHASGLMAGELGDICETLKAKLDDEIVSSAKAAANAVIQCVAKDIDSPAAMRRALATVCR